MKLLIFILLLAANTNAQVSRIELPVPRNLDRADLYVLRPVVKPRAVLVLCPGYNGNGRWLAESKTWQEFARSHELGVCGLSFSSPEEIIAEGKGYMHPAQGAGKVLLAGIRQAFGDDIPILVFGFSAGAQFAARLVESHPDRVLAWCAYAAGSWDEPLQTPGTPPGIVACGSDDPRYGACLGYFLQGRAINRKWTWISLGGTGHKMTNKLDLFVREFFAQILEPASMEPEWRDVDLKTPLTESEMKSQPTLACWLPSKAVAKIWVDTHQP